MPLEQLDYGTRVLECVHVTRVLHYLERRPGRQVDDLLCFFQRVAVIFCPGYHDSGHRDAGQFV